MKGMKNGLVLATAAAALLASGFVATTSAANNAEVKCMGINSCKGTGACKSINNACKGQNTCKGQGLTMEKSAETCTQAGGTVVTE